MLTSTLVAAPDHRTASNAGPAPSLAELMALVRAEPENIENWLALGATLGEMNELESALRCFLQADRLDPTGRRAALPLARLWARAGDLDNAADGYERAIRNAGDPTGALRLELAEQCARLKQPDQALAHIRVLGRSSAAALEVLRAAAELAEELESITDAEAMYREAARRATDPWRDQYHLGLLFQNHRRYSDAKQMYRAALRTRSFVEAELNLAAVHQILRERTDAIDAYRRALSINPRETGAWRNLTAMKRFTSRQDPDLRAMERLVTDAPALSTAHRSWLHFALAKAFDDLDQPELAGPHYEDANHLMAEIHAWDGDAHDRFCDDMLAGAPPPDWAAPRGDDATDRRLIFIVGMPRSGSTLIEQILAQHPAVSAGGELNQLERAIHNCIGPAETPALEATSDAIFAARKQYLAYVSTVAATPYFTDKMPANSHYVGWIRALFPEATIIWTTRSPRATCWSCFQTYFTNGHAYSYRQEALARYFGQQQRLLKAWQARYPSHLVPAAYERVVTNSDTEIRRLLTRCGLSYDPHCLRFHEGRDPVSTASLEQVRRPLYRRSLQRWKQYRPWLKILDQELPQEEL